jgi:two-component system, chemotaxis family, sensor kinase CheA
MSEAQQQLGGAETDFDLTQFYQIFFEEAGENLDLMEQMLLGLNLQTADDEELNGIFRCAHSVKGGAATFGFTDVAELTHHMESLLDGLRRHEVEPNSAMVDVLLASADVSRSLLARHQAGGAGLAPPTEDLVARIRILANGGDASAEPTTGDDTAQTALAGSSSEEFAPVMADPAGEIRTGLRVLEIVVGPLTDMAPAEAIREMFRDIPDLGTIENMVSEQADVRKFMVCTSSVTDELLDLFEFHVSRSQITITEITPPVHPGLVPSSASAEAEVAGCSDVLGQDLVKTEPVTGYGFFEGAPGAPDSAPVLSLARPSMDSPPAKAVDKAPTQLTQIDAATIRVSVSKVDQLINLVGELVITQAMLAQNSRALDAADYQKMLAGLADLERNTRDLQESVMSIRMIPMSVVFSRFPRMLRDLASKLGKKVNFVTLGESTELDKGLVEKITDPLTHLVRNSCDHGVETPEERRRSGKSETGTITLSAAHQGGSIVIEVRDDGRGMSREKILSKARLQGLEVSDQMTDSEVWQLIFAPGFSTAEVVTDVSGRGVGMDVVKRNISALNGTVEIDSAEGYGMKVSVRLPLTLAIMDGMSIGVGNEVYMLPLSSVVESFQLKDDAINTLGHQSQLVKVRDEYMPVVQLERVFQVPRHNRDRPSDIMVVIEAEGSRVALLVDDLLGQQQVVVKNLESNYRKVPNISGATILGDGKVALILDTVALVRRPRH